MKPAHSHRTLALQWQWWRPSSFSLTDVSDLCEDILSDICDEPESYIVTVVMWYIVFSAPIWGPNPGISQWSWGRWIAFAFYTLPIAIPAGALVMAGIKWIVQHPPVKIVTQYKERAK